MRRLACVVLLAIASAGQNASDNRILEGTVLRLDAELRRALANKDLPALEQIYADDYLHVDSNGVVTSKAQRIGEFKTGQRIYTSLEREDVRVKIYGNIALMTSRDILHAKAISAKLLLQLRTTLVYSNQNGYWQLTKAQTTQIISGHADLHRDPIAQRAAGNAISLAAPSVQPQIESDKIQGTEAEREIAQAVRDWAKAQVDRNTRAIEQIEADDFIFTSSAGEIFTKTQDIADVSSGDWHTISLALADMQVSIYGDAAVVMSRTIRQGTYKDQDASGQFRWMDVLVKEGGHWQLVAHHGTRIVVPSAGGSWKH